MDKLNKYRQLIKEALTEYADLLKSPPTPPYDVVLAFDDEHNEYILREVGWTKNAWVRNTVVHVSLRDGKVWIQEDWTEEGIASWLLQHGVERSQIVLSFQPPESRQLMEFVVA